MQEHLSLSRIRVSTSKIHGTGVYATAPIKKGERIIEYVGERISSEEGTRRESLDSEKTYIFILNDREDIDGSVGGNGSQFINHCCDPNADTETINDHIFIFALHDIAEGEEITFDYSFDKDADPVPCKCGKEKCRGYINEYASDEEKAEKIAQFSRK